MKTAPTEIELIRERCTAVEDGNRPKRSTQGARELIFGLKHFETLCLIGF